MKRTRTPRKTKKRLKKLNSKVSFNSNAFLNCNSFTNDIKNWQPQKGLDWGKMFENLGK